MRRGLTIAVALASVILLGACNYLAEGAKGLAKSPSYSEVKERQKNWKPPSQEQLEKWYGECPKFNGVFKNDAEEKNGPGQLQRFFIVEGFEAPATSYRGGREGDEPIPTSGRPIDLLGGEKNGVRQYYRQTLAPPPRITLELRPLGLGRFRIGVKSSSGLSGVSDLGRIDLFSYYGSSDWSLRCENAVIKSFWTGKAKNKTVMVWELFVESGTGDIVIHYPDGVSIYDWPPGPERYIRYKRVGN